MRIDLSDFIRLGDEYADRAQRALNNPFGNRTRIVEEALRDALKKALEMGNQAQAMLSNDYEQTHRGHYGSSGTGDMSIVNPQEFLDPAGVAKVKAETGQTGTHKSMYGSSSVVVQHSGSESTFSLITEATMTPYPNWKTGRHEPTRPTPYYLREGWIDPDNPEHRMQPRPFGRHVINAFRPFIPQLARHKLLSEGFKEV